MNTFDEVYAVPGANNIIDMINPVTGLTVYSGRTQEQVLSEEPTAVRMTWEDWRAEATARQNTPITWSPTFAGKYQEMLEVLPPALWIGGAFLVGEPWDHSFATGQPRFAAYWRRNDKYFVASRPLTCAELRMEIGR